MLTVVANRVDLSYLLWGVLIVGGDLLGGRWGTVNL